MAGSMKAATNMNLISTFWSDSNATDAYHAEHEIQFLPKMKHGFHSVSTKKKIK